MWQACATKNWRRSMTSDKNKGMEKIARICWNTHEWKRPSGSEGKSQSDGSYEKEIGFGHEEWILDDSRIYEPDGYHYGFLQPMNVASGKHIGAVYDIHLFSISPLKQKVYIGCLHNAVGVSPGKARWFTNITRRKAGWMRWRMKSDLQVEKSRTSNRNGSSMSSSSSQRQRSTIPTSRYWLMTPFRGIDTTQNWYNQKQKALKGEKWHKTKKYFAVQLDCIANR